MLIGGFQPFTLSDFPGRTAAIVFTQGCNFRCPYCHNRRLWPNAPHTVDPPTAEEVLALLSKRRGYLRGLVITGGEPTLQTDLISFIREVKQLGMAVKLDTNGSRPNILEDLLVEALVDNIAMDVKAPWNKYALICGRGVDLSAIRQSIGIIAASLVPHHFRTTFFKTLLSQSDIEAIRNMLPPHSNLRIQPHREAQR